MLHDHRSFPPVFCDVARSEKLLPASHFPVFASILPVTLSRTADVHPVRCTCQRSNALRALIANALHWTPLRVIPAKGGGRALNPECSTRYTNVTIWESEGETGWIERFK
jgi:hypothetical protein